MDRRNFLAFTAAASLTGPAWAQQAHWPQGPVRLVVPFPPGGPSDVLARILAERLAPKWGVPVIVDNKPGASTLVGASAVVNGPHDGSAFLVTVSVTLRLPLMLATVPFDPNKELVPAGAIATEPLMLVVNSNVKANTLADLIRLVKAEPAKFSFGTYGVGSAAHLALIEINKAAGVNLVHIPYKGSTLLVPAVVAGDVPIGMSNLGTLKPHIQSGKVRAIAVTGGERYRFAPEVPTLAEFGIKGFDSPLWLGVFAPARTPKPIIAKFNEALRETLRTPEVAKRIQDYSQDPAPISLEEFQKMVERDNETAFPMIRASGVRLD